MKRIPRTKEQILVRKVFENGRIRPYRGGGLAGEFRYIARWLKKKNGLALDEMADALGMDEKQLLDELTMINPSGIY